MSVGRPGFLAERRKTREKAEITAQRLPGGGGSNRAFSLGSAEDPSLTARGGAAVGAVGSPGDRCGLPGAKTPARSSDNQPESKPNAPCLARAPERGAAHSPPAPILLFDRSAMRSGQRAFDTRHPLAREPVRPLSMARPGARPQARPVSRPRLRSAPRLFISRCVSLLARTLER